MSWRLAEQAYTLDLPHSETYVLVTMCRYANDDGTSCFPGLSNLVWDTGYDRRQVQRLLKSLQYRGVLEIVAYPSGGRGRSTEYAIHLGACSTKIKSDILPPFSAGETVTLEAENSDIFAEKGDIYDIKGDISAQNSDILPPHSVISTSQDSVINSSHVTQNAGARVRDKPDYGYANFDAFFLAFWSASNGSWKVGKAAARALCRDIEPPRWRDAVSAVGNYFASSVVSRGYVKRPDNWLSNGDWEDYVDGPVVDKPALVVSNGATARQERAARLLAIQRGAQQVAREGYK